MGTVLGRQLKGETENVGCGARHERDARRFAPVAEGRGCPPSLNDPCEKWIIPGLVAKWIAAPLPTVGVALVARASRPPARA